MKTRIKAFVLTSLLVTAPSMHGRAGEDSFDEGFLNQPFNLRYGSQNPTHIVYNSVRDFAEANVGYSMTRGDFHATDRSAKDNELRAAISGLRRIGRFDLQGHLAYHNQQAKQQRWNSTLWNNPYNPFMLCDSILSDFSTESFDMAATGAYTFSDRLHVALDLGVRTGSLANQTDPRPHTTTSIIPITAGADYRVADSWSLGLSAGVRVFTSHVDYTNVLATVGYTYFLMKGMGDYLRRSTADEPGYRRDYKGMTYSGALSATWQPQGGRIANFIEVGYATQSEDATDGSTSYEFRGGDFADNTFTVQDRLQLKSSNSALHNITLAASYANGKGTWFDQKRETDFEHGNIQYYRILGSAVNHKAQRLTAAIGYQLDLLRNGQRDLFASAQITYSDAVRKQIFGGATPKQTIDLLGIEAQVGKNFAIRKATLLAQVVGGYVHPLTKDYANGSTQTGANDISAAYTRRVFEYQSARNAHFGAHVDACLPAGKKLAVGLYANADCRLYLDNEEYWQGYDGHSQTTMEVGAYLKF